MIRHLTRLTALLTLVVICASQAHAYFTVTAAPRWKPSDPTVQNVVLSWDPIDGVGDSDYVVYCDGVLAQNQGPSQIQRNANTGKIECKQPLPGYDRNVTQADAKPHVFKVVAVKDGVEQTASNMVSKETTVYHVDYVAPKFHANKYKIKLAAGKYTDNVRIHWEEPTTGVATEYVLKRKTVGKTGWEDLAVLPAGVTEFVDKTVDLANNKYRYRVNARMSMTLALANQKSTAPFNFVRFDAENPGTSTDESNPYEQISSVMDTSYDTPVLSAPKIANGRNALSLYWTLKQTAKKTPTYYKVYRNNTLVATIDGMSTVDSNIPDNNDGETYTYRVVAVYINANGYIDRELESASKTLANPVKLDLAKSRYAIDVVYNYPIIDSHDDNYKTHKNKLGDAYVEGTGTFTNLKYALGQGAPGDIYRQAVYSDGLWYISQLTDDDNLSTYNKLTNKNSVSAYIEKATPGSKGGIVRVNANDPRKTINFNAYYDSDGTTRNTDGRTFSTKDRSNQSVAIDEVTKYQAKGKEHVIFRSVYPFLNNTSTDDDYKQLFTCETNYIYYRKRDKDANGKWGDWSAMSNNYLTLPTKIPYEDSQFRQFGRVHYITANGALSSAAGGDIFMAPNRTAQVYVHRMVSEKLTKTTVYECPVYSESKNGDCLPKGYNLEDTINIENYVYPIPGRGADDLMLNGTAYKGSHFIHFIRHAGVYYVNGESGYYHRIYDADEAHTAGGCVFDFGDDKFILNPTSATRNNTGHFRIDICDKEAIKDDDGNVTGYVHYNGYKSFQNLSPAVAVVQDELTDFIAGNSNANWYGTEYSEKDNCVYIYQYVPGVRFAKYRFYKLNDFPRVDPTLDIEIAHETQGETTKVQKFNAVMTWQRPTNYDFSGSTNYSLDHYKVELLNEAGKTICSWDQTEEVHNNANASVEYNFTFDGKTLYDNVNNKVVLTVDKGKYHIDNQDYTLKVTPVFKSTTGDVIYGETRTDEANNDYQAAIVARDARLFRNGGNAARRLYRVDLDFDLDYTLSGTDFYFNQPADFFTIEVSKDGGNTWEHIPNLIILHGNNKLQNPAATSARHHTVPGHYRFERDAVAAQAKLKAVNVNTSDPAWIVANTDKRYSNEKGDAQMEVLDQATPCVAYYTFEEDYSDAKELEMLGYKYRYTIYHASDNSFITRSASDTAGVSASITTTGVNDIVAEEDVDAPVEYYNLQGIRLYGEPTPGQIVIRRQGRDVQKIRF